MSHESHWTVSNILDSACKDYHQKDRNSSKGVDLSAIEGEGKNRVPARQRKSRSEARISTDPYCPSVRAMSSDDAPFIFKSNEKFSAIVGRNLVMDYNLGTRSRCCK